MENLVAHIQSIQSSLPKQQRLLCDYICNHLFEASMLTIAELAEKAGVGTATVTRMVYSLGYSSYSQLKLDLREQAVSHAKSSYHAYWDMHREQTAEFDVSSQLEICGELIQSLNNPLYMAQIESAAEAILAARRVYILGLRTSLISAQCLEYRLSDEGLDVCSLSRESEFLFDRLMNLQPGDLLVTFASKPATKKTVDAVKICAKRGISTLLVTTGPFEELEPYTTHMINTNTFDALLAVVPPVVTVELLSCEISRRNGGHSKDRIQQLEKLLKDNNVTIWD